MGPDIQFVVFLESHGDMNYLGKILKDLNLRNTVLLKSRVPRKEFLSACLGANILLLLVGHDYISSGAIPGKLFSYFACCRPILVVGPQDCEAGRMVEQLNRGIAVPDDEPDQIADAIERLLIQEGRYGRLDLSMDTVLQFENKTVIEKLAQFFNEILPI